MQESPIFMRTYDFVHMAYSPRAENSRAATGLGWVNVSSAWRWICRSTLVAAGKHTE